MTAKALKDYLKVCSIGGAEPTVDGLYEYVNSNADKYLSHRIGFYWDGWASHKAMA